MTASRWTACAVECAVVMCVMAGPALGQDEAARKAARAVRTEPGSIRLDGRLDDVAWTLAVPVSDFVQKEPVENAKPTQSIEIRFAYDDTALYIGARMFSADASTIQAPMSRRDDTDQAEYLLVELDTYHDRRTAYAFGVTASGVRLDHYHASDNEDSFDATYDPVWEAKAVIDAQGWTAEMWLPFSQLRFNEESGLVWGLDIKRSVPSLEEQDYWVPVPRTARGWSSQFGELRGVERSSAPHRLEILPYVASSSLISGSRNLSNPFDNGLNLTGRVGADIKVGLGSSLTLDATVNPDFGQIEADPAEVNLTAFETLFTERRPFFIEGSSLLQADATNYFYSRRIGARPAGPASGDFVDYPDSATILGAAKLTGRLASGTSIGALGAVTGEEFARTATAQLVSRTRVAPRTTYGLAHVLQQFGSQESTAGIHVTAMQREIPAGDPLAAVLARSALTFEGASTLRFRDRTYEASFNAGGAWVDGEPAALERIQRSSRHYLQRPDSRNVFNPARRSLAGGHYEAALDKITGRHWLWGGGINGDTPEFESNEFGRLNYAGDLITNVHLNYRETTPGRVFRSYALNFTPSFRSFQDVGFGVRPTISGNVNLTWRNFWVSTIRQSYAPRGMDAQLTRGGPAMAVPRTWSVSGSHRNSSSQQTRWSVNTSFSGSANDDSSRSIDGSFAARPAPAWQFSVTPSYESEMVARQYVSTVKGGRPETYGSRYVFGLIDRTTFSAQIRVGYTLRPDLNLDVYAEPFAASGRYLELGELLAARSSVLRVYGENGIGLIRLADGSYRVDDGATSLTLPNGDFNVRSFRSNVVLKWEWRPGSLLFVVWQQNRASSEPRGDHVGLGDLFGSLSAPGDHVLALKVSYWLSAK